MNHHIVKRFFMIFVFLTALTIPVAWALALTQDDIQQIASDNVIRGTAAVDGVTAVQNARITARKLSGGAVYEAFTDANGAYTLTVPSGAATWRAQAETTGATIPADAQPPGVGKLAAFGIGGPHEETGVDFAFTLPSASIMGQVLIEGTPDVAPAFPVTVTAVSPIHDDVAAPINPDGTFTLAVSPGLYTVYFDVDSDAYRGPLPQVGSAEDGGTWNLGVQYLVQTGQFAKITGQVLLASSGLPAPNAPVMAVPMDTTWPPVSEESLGAAEVTYTNANGEFTHTVRAGMYWVAVDIGDPSHNYYPYLDAWQTAVTVGPMQTVTGTELLVEQADSHIQAILTDGAGGAQATDACGLAATYKAQDVASAVYNFRRFEGGAFDMPVISGTYRLAVQPNPDIDRLLNMIPEPPLAQSQVTTCASGKYLATIEPHIVVGVAETVPITIPLTAADATIYATLWDIDADQALTGTTGHVMGWQDGSWTATAVYTPTGTGALNASDGVWWLAYQVAEESGYKTLPGVWRVTVPVTATEVSVKLPVYPARAVISGIVTAPDGSPVAHVPVAAINTSPVVGAGERTLTDENGRYTLYLNYGAYRVTAFRPPAWRDNGVSAAWITPAPQSVILTPNASEAQVDLQFRNGDAVIHGRLSLDSMAQTLNLPDGFQMPAIVWGTSASGRSYTQAPMPMGPDDEYTLPALQGEEWLVGATFVDTSGETVWITATVITVDAADISQDLTLTDNYTTVHPIGQMMDPNHPYLAELVEKVSVYIPAGAMPDGELLRLFVEEVQPGPALMELYAALSSDWQTALCDLYGICLDLEDIGGGTGLQLLAPPVRVYAENLLGQASNGSLNLPAVIRIPYDAANLGQTAGAASTSVASGPSETNIQPLYYDEMTGGWQPVDEYIVDTDNNEVVIFSDQLGTFALVGSADYAVYLPLVVR